MQQVMELRYYEDGKLRPYLHLVDGGVSDNLGVRAVLEVLDELEALRMEGVPTPLDRARRLAIFVVNSLSAPPLGWDAQKHAPGSLEILLRATGVPIDNYSHEAVELLRDTAARWKFWRGVRDAVAVAGNGNADLAKVTRTPDLEIYVIDVSFAALRDERERAYLNGLPTSFALPPEAVDRLRAAAGAIVLDSPDFRRYLKDMGERIVKKPAAGVEPAPAR
jgi:NTE family protein